MKWSELSQLKIGDRVRFARAWDVFPQCVVEAGTLGVVHDISRIYGRCYEIMPDNKDIRAALKEWNGCVQLYYDDFMSEEAPIEIVCQH